MTEIKRPVAFLGDLAVDAVPDYLEHLAVVARIINGFALYESQQSNLERALHVIVMTHDELTIARQVVLETLESCVAEAGQEGHGDEPKQT